MPKIIYSHDPRVAGKYIHPERTEVLIDDRYIDASRGIILISTITPEEEFAGTLYHEWRHHWQAFNIGARSWAWLWQPSDDYEESIRQYFKAPHELDALLFEYKYARNDTNDYWIGLIQGE